MGLFLLLRVILLLGVVVSSCLAQGSIHHYDFFVKETNYTMLCNTKSITTVNDSFPGPVIRAHKGDIVYVNVHNEGVYGITLHWHGVRLPGNPWSDGPDHITQCQIQPGKNFTYDVQLTEEEGTLWWHAHSDWTRATIHGAFIVLPAVGTTYPFPEPDEEEVIVLANWYTGNLTRLLEYSFTNGSNTPQSDGYTINGQPGDFSPCASNETIYRMLVDPGKTYLLRIINAANNANLFFAIADHKLTVVGVDGAYTKPLVSDYILLSTGKSMDVLVTANQSPSHYYMAARQYSSSQLYITNFDHMNVTAVFQYRGNYTTPGSAYFPSKLPIYKDHDAAITFIDSLRSLASEDHPINVPESISTQMYLVASMGMIICPNHSCGGIHGERMASSLNNISWIDPSTSILQAYYRNMSGVYKTDFPNHPTSYYNYTGEDLPDNTSIPMVDTRVKVLEFGETVEIVIQGTNVFETREEHPIHLHGYNFYVVGSGFGNFDEESDPKGYNLIDPPYMNTVAVPRNGWATIRFVANNPGVWFLHCHYDRHMSWGMDTVLIVKNGNTIETSMRPPPAYLPPCPAPIASSFQILNVSYRKDNYTRDVI